MCFFLTLISHTQQRMIIYVVIKKIFWFTFHKYNNLYSDSLFSNSTLIQLSFSLLSLFFVSHVFLLSNFSSLRLCVSFLRLSLFIPTVFLLQLNRKIRGMRIMKNGFERRGVKRKRAGAGSSLWFIVPNSWTMSLQPWFRSKKWH